MVANAFSSPFWARSRARSSAIAVDASAIPASRVSGTPNPLHAKSDEFARPPRSLRTAMYRATSHSVVHLELHTSDRALAEEKYEALCGWRAEEIKAAGAPTTLSPWAESS